MIGLWVTLGVLLLGLLTGIVFHRREGQVKATSPADGSAEVKALPTPVADALDPSAAVTLVQISTSFCAPCRHARAVLSQLANTTEGLSHVELDVTSQPDIARKLGVWRTPTTLAMDPHGRELLRVYGVPDGRKLREALTRYLRPVG